MGCYRALKLLTKIVTFSASRNVAFPRGLAIGVLNYGDAELAMGRIWLRPITIVEDMVYPLAKGVHDTSP